ncbi:MAG: MBL fold metallo-hydrolase [Kiritimatiellia bacterium]
MRIKCLIVGPFEVNCFIVSNQPGRAIVIDPGSEADRIAAELRKHNLSVDAYLLTHGHIDHISALADLVESIPAPIAMGAEDLLWAFDASNCMPPFYGPTRMPAGTCLALKEGSTGNAAGLSYTIIATPGHTPGSVCIHFPAQNTLFSGDTLFAGSVGRSDLPGGDAFTLQESLTRLAALPESTVVYPGHGPHTTVGTERKTNFFLRGE